MNKSTLALLLLSVFSGAVNSAAIPRSSGADARVQEILYDENNVTVVKVKQGTATLIQLEKGEYLKGDYTGMGLGDPLAWNVSVRGNNIFLRPIADEPDTNIALVTNRRTYSVLLSSAGKGHPTYVMRYVYPVEPDPISKSNKIRDKKLPPCFDGDVINTRYKVKGSDSLKPSAIWDNGEFTCFKWSSSVDLPVVYRVLADGSENLVNYSMDENVMVVHDVSPDFILRLGNSAMAVKANYKVERGYNYKGTTNGEKLMEIE